MSKRLSATISIGSVLEGSFSNNIGLIKSGLREVGTSIKTVKARQRDLAAERDALLKIGENVDDLDQEYRELTGTLDKLLSKQRALQGVMSATNRVGSTFSSLTSEIGRTGRRLGVTLGAAAASITATATATAKTGDHIAKTADTLGLGIDQYQALAYAADRAGVSQENFDSNMTAFVKRLGEAAEGTGEAKAAYDALGLSAEDLAKQGPAAALSAVADAISQIEGAAERSAVLSDLFSRSGVNMANMLRNGSGELEERAAEAEKLGLMLSEETARGAEAFTDSMADAGYAVRGLRDTIGAELMPVIGEAAQAFTAFMSDEENRAEVGRFARELAEGVREALPLIGEAAQGLGTVAKHVGSIAKNVADMLGGWENLGVAVGVVFSAGVIVKAAGFAASVGSLAGAMLNLVGVNWSLVAGGIKAIGVALTANPIGLAIAAIGAGAALIIANWDKIEPAIRPVLDWMGERFTALKNHLAPIFSWLGGSGASFSDAWAAAQGIIQGVLDKIGAAFDWLMEKIRPVIAAIQWLNGEGQAIATGSAARLEGRTAPSSGNEGTPSTGSSGRLDSRAVGGTFHGTRPLLVGENGPELLYPRQPGFVAHNRHLRNLADLSERAAGALGAAAPASAPVQQFGDIVIHAHGADADAVLARFEQKRRELSELALFDRPRGASGFA